MAEKSGLELMLESMKGFSESVKNYAISNAANNARTQIDEINANITDEGEKAQAMKMISNDLAARLTGLGADAAKIQAIGNQLAPSYQTAQEAMLAQGMTGQETFDYMKRADIEKAERQAAALAGKNDRKEAIKQLAAQQKAFTSGVNKLQEASINASKAVQLLESNDPAVMRGAMAAIPILMPKASGDVGNLSAIEQDVWRNIDKRIISQFWQTIGTAAEGKFIESNRESLLKIARLYAGSSKQIIQDRAKRAGQQLASLGLYEDDADTLAKKIYADYSPENAASASVAPAGTTAAPASGGIKILDFAKKVKNGKNSMTPIEWK